MWIKLICPESTKRSLDTAFKTHMAPPLALLILGALTPPEHRVTLQDENVERLTLDDRPDLVGITVKVDTAYRSFQIARAYRSRGIPVVFGGIHATVCPDATVRYADSVVVGEGEPVWGEVLKDAQKGKLKRFYRGAGTPDLAGTPIARWELLEGKNYLFTNTLTMSRGCPFRCDFCYGSSMNLPRGYRTKPVGNVLAEIASLGTRHLFFIDDNFIGSPGKTRELLRAMRPLGLTWHTAVSADIGRHEDILDMMASSGCKSLFIGFETLNEKSLSGCNKQQNRIEEYSRTIKRIHERGMMVNASMVFGFDGDGPELFRKTLDWLVEHKIETMTGHILTPFPGTPFYQRLLSEDRIIDFDLRNYNTSQVVFEPKGMSAEQLRRGFLWMYREFYSWPRIAERMPEARSQRMAFLLFNVFYRKLGPMVSILGRMGLMGNLARIARALSYPRSGSRHGAGSAPAPTKLAPREERALMP